MEDRDMRYLTTAEEVFQALLEHIQLATHKGKIRSLITIFAPQAPNSPGIRNSIGKASLPEKRYPSW